MAMLCVYTAFDKSDRPLISGVFDVINRTAKFYTFYISGTNKTYSDIDRTKEEFKRIIESGEQIVINDYKRHVMQFGVGKLNVFDVPIAKLPNIHNIVGYKSAMAKILMAMKNIEPRPWHKIRAHASVAYANMQSRGLIYNYDTVYPQWDIDTYSGRSRASGFAIQGISSDPGIKNINNHKLFIHFDWVAADYRVMAIMSKDERLEESFKNSDPYTYVADYLNMNASEENRLSRSEVKISMLAGVNSFDTSGAIMGFYFGLRDWLSECKRYIDANGKIKNIVGRSFKVGGDRTDKSVFNASVQGSVAIAMQNTISKIHDEFPDSILVETHDSIVITAKDNADAKDKIDVVSEIMTHPYCGVLDSNPTFPIVVSVGKSYGSWKKLKRLGWC